ncbi:GIY-YIG nuclease family protein [Halosimplex marinum]|uniref:GIY-YIG nuclease family protein n=1 Tax=Halosimplex marinum TaxID=3396620 RepID=UPI003F577495
MTAGTYTLVVELAAPATVEVGALGEREFAAGAYAYTGSAFGPGGFARVERHRELAAGERDARHWHVDYLLGHPDAGIDAVVRTAEADVECAVSRTLADEERFERVDGFGASDCDCDSHLAYAADGARLRRAVERAHGTDGRA